VWSTSAPAPLDEHGLLSAKKGVAIAEIAKTAFQVEEVG